MFLLRSSYQVPDGFIRISRGAFQERSITSIIIPDSVLSIGAGSFEDCHELASVSLGNGITRIEDYAFFSNTALTSIVLPDSLTAIEWVAFSNCHSLASILLPDGLSNIAEYAFSRNTALTSITIPRSVTKIGRRAFWSCPSLTSVKVSANTTIHPDAFEDCVALHALAARYDMDVNSYLIQVPIIRASFYHFLLCERVGSFLQNKDDIMKVIAGFLFIYPEPAPVADNYVLPTAAHAAQRLEEQLELHRQDKEARGSSSSSSSSSSSAPVLRHDAPNQSPPPSNRRRL
jgi:hypothetical protein